MWNALRRMTLPDKPCPRCRQSQPLGARFCNHCGAPFAVPARSAAPWVAAVVLGLLAVAASGFAALHVHRRTQAEAAAQRAWLANKSRVRVGMSRREVEALLGPPDRVATEETLNGRARATLQYGRTTYTFNWGWLVAIHEY